MPRANRLLMNTSKNPKLWTRREFLTRSLGVIAVATTVPSFLSRTALVLGNPLDTAGVSSGIDGKILVVIQLGGGNDGLNTVIPFTHHTYYKLRPTIAIPKGKVIRVTDDIGFHPSLTPFKGLYDEGKLAVVQGVGYPNPDRSHFRSMEIWQSAISDDYETSGWVGRMFDQTCGNGQALSSHVANGARLPCSPTLAVSIGETLNPALTCQCSVGVALRDAEQFYKMTQVSAKTETVVEGVNAPSSASLQLDFLRRTAMNAGLSADRIRKSVRSVQAKTDYPKEPFAQGMKLIASMIAGGMDTRVYYISLTGFDTHANQPATQERLLKNLAEGVAAFQKDIELLGQADRVLGFTFSEFGRRVAQNGSNGTDHGQAAPMFIFGKSVKPGFIGAHPSLDHLNDGDLKFQTDFRQVYATVLDRWMGVDSSAVLKHAYEKVPIIA